MPGEIMMPASKLELLAGRRQINHWHSPLLLLCTTPRSVLFICLGFHVIQSSSLFSENCLKSYKFKNEVYFNLLFYTVFTELCPSLSFTLPPPLAVRYGFGYLHLLEVCRCGSHCTIICSVGLAPERTPFMGDTLCWMIYITEALAYHCAIFPFKKIRLVGTPGTTALCGFSPVWSSTQLACLVVHETSIMSPCLFLTAMMSISGP